MNNMSKMNPVVHFEMPAEDGKRMSEFYTKVFGWQTREMGPESGNYIIAQTTESEVSAGGTGRPKNPGTINGGFFPKKDSPAKYPMVVIAVDDIHESMKKITDGGGKVFGEPVDIPGVGAYVSFEDTEGNRSSILQPKGM